MSDFVNNFNYSVKCEYLIKDSDKMEKDEYFDALEGYCENSSDSGYGSDIDHNNYYKNLELELKNMSEINLSLTKDNVKQGKEIEKLKQTVSKMTKEITKKDRNILELNKQVECDMEKLLDCFQVNINSERELCSKMHNYKMQVMEKNLDKITENKIISDRVASLKMNINADIVRNGKLQTLIVIGDYLNEIEKNVEKNIQSRVFQRHVDKSVINLIGGRCAIENLSMEEIKTKLFNMTIEIPSIERLVQLRKECWKGNIEPIVYKTELENKYKHYNHDGNLQLSFNEILKNNITNSIKEKEIWKSLFDKNPNETMSLIAQRYNLYGKNYFFSSESKCFQTVHHIKEHPKTPYQGQKKSRGRYNCSNCHRRWVSHNSYSNEAQECLQCGVHTYPYKQYALTIHDDIDMSNQSKTYLKNPYGKCKNIGYYFNYSNIPYY